MSFADHWQLKRKVERLQADRDGLLAVCKTFVENFPDLGGMLSGNERLPNEISVKADELVKIMQKAVANVERFGDQQ